MKKKSAKEKREEKIDKLFEKRRKAKEELMNPKKIPKGI